MHGAICGSFGFHLLKLLTGDFQSGDIQSLEVAGQRSVGLILSKVMLIPQPLSVKKVNDVALPVAGHPLTKFFVRGISISMIARRQCRSI
jgi:hypothetical protein